MRPIGGKFMRPPLPALTAGSSTCASRSPSTPPSTISSIASASTSASTLLFEKPIVFSTASSGMRSRTACAIVLPVRRISVKNTAAMIAPTMSPMSPSCLTNATIERLLGLRLRFVIGVRRQRVDCGRDLFRFVRIVDARDVPADRAVAERAAFVEVVPVKNRS